VRAHTDTENRAMNAMMFDPQSVDCIALDSQTPNPPTERFSTSPARRPLVCRWQRTAEGRLFCVWQQIGADEARNLPWESPAERFRQR